MRTSEAWDITVATRGSEMSSSNIVYDGFNQIWRFSIFRNQTNSELVKTFPAWTGTVSCTKMYHLLCAPLTSSGSSLSFRPPRLKEALQAWFARLLPITLQHSPPLFIPEKPNHDAPYTRIQVRELRKSFVLFQSDKLFKWGSPETMNLRTKTKVLLCPGSTVLLVSE